MEKTNKYSERDWEEIASYLAGENKIKNENIKDFLDNEGQEIENYWTMIDNNRRDNKVNVDEAWGKLFSRLQQDNLVNKDVVRRSAWTHILRVAAVVIVLAATTLTLRFFMKEDTKPGFSAVATAISEKNRVLELPDGSVITLNRESELIFPDSFDNDVREVKLRGEAFFDITSDPSKPFIVDAGDAQVRVLGTSFNVISSNDNKETEVFVKSGKVLLCSSDGADSMTLEPGYIGTIDKSDPVRKLNTNPNYLSWNTDILSYDGVRLEQVFYDIKRTHNISVKVMSDSILDHKLTSEFRNNTPEVIIQSICTSFNLSFEKKGGIYYLSK